jgi:LuxR family maltose regulon positive regulatory protein
LTTKIYTPPPRPNLVERPRLIARLNEGLHLGHKLTLISAPAGFGKTTLLSEWVTESERPVAWLSLDEGDNDPAQFLTYLVTALQRAEADLGQGLLDALRAPQRPPIKTLLTSLINQIDALDDELILVLDDYHLITNQSIHEALGFLLDHLPRNLHLVVATRADPPLPLARLRGRGQLTELRQADLRFTPKEAAAFLERVSGLHLETEQIAALEERTEGWITGLQLAALSMRGRENVSGFVSAFAGSHRYVLDYLTEEVLQRRPEDVRDFLLQTSILDRLSGPLCDAILQAINSQSVLEHLEAANLFLVPLDDRRVWYRYHRLFSDLLRARLEEMYPERVPELYRRASAWYEREDMLDEAMKHAAAGSDLEHAAHIVETHGRSLLLRGELTTLLRWIGALPQEMIQASARICVTHAWALLLTGQPEGIEPRLQRAERVLEAAPDDPLLGDVAVIRAYKTAQQGDAARTIRLAHQALERLTSTRQGERGVAFFVLGGAHILDDDWTAAADALNKAATVGRRGGNLHIAVPALNSLAGIQATQGHLRQAQATAEEAIGLVTGADGQPLPIAAGAVSALAELAYEWNDLDDALAHARQSVELGRLWGNSDTLGFSYLTLAEVLAAHGCLDKARDALREAERLSQEVTLSPSFFAQLRATRARLWLVEGDLTAAARWVERMSFDHADPFRAEESLALARARLALGEPDSALQIMSPLLKMARSRGLTSWVIGGLALRALAHYTEGDEPRALAALAEALTLAEPEGYVRRFVDLGLAIAPLLRKAASQGITPDYVGDLLSAFNRVDEEMVPQAQPLIEPLSPREIEVLSLVAEGLSNREVGRRLHIAESTVKSHLNHVYGKLGVDNRIQAAAKARSLNLLSSLAPHSPY